MDYKIHIEENPWYDDNTKIYIYAYNVSEGKSYYLTIKDGLFIINPKEEGEKAKEPAFTLVKSMKNTFLSSLTEELKRNGFVAEVDNSQRISAEALNKEKDEQIGWLRSQIEKQL